LVRVKPDATDLVVSGFSRTTERQDIVLDLVFVAASIGFFALSVAYVALCDALNR